MNLEIINLSFWLAVTLSTFPFRQTKNLEIPSLIENPQPCASPLSDEDSITLLFKLNSTSNAFFDHRSNLHGEVCTCSPRLNTFFLLRLLFFRFHGYGFCLGFNCPGFPYVRHLFCGAVLVHRRKVVQFGTVCLEIVQFPCPVGTLGHQFPFSDPYCPVPFMLPEDWVFALSFLPEKGRPKILPAWV